MVLISSYVFSQDSLQSMHDAFARGFQATKAKNHDEAVQWFQKAGQFAIQAREWKGCLDSGNALLKLGEPGQAADLFEQSFQIAQEKKDWRIAVASGYAFASLPPDLGKRPNASNSFLLAADLANQNHDWIGMTEAANALIHIEDRESAIRVLNDAKIIVDETKSAKGAQVTAQLYERLDLTNEAQGMKVNREDYIKFSEGAKKTVPQPPPGWSPVGESVAGPPIPSVEQQRLARESADKDIESKNQWILQQQQIEYEKEKQASEYSGYYYYPYGYSSYTTYQPWGWDALIPWADHYAGQYSYSDGYYQHHGGYSGFGFDFGYADHNSFFGFSIYGSDY
jgi:hypothetical protein